MKNIPFFIRHGLSNLNHNRQRTLFVLFSIAVGVAAIVSLRTLGLMIGDSLTHNLQAENRGDVVVTVPYSAIASGGEYDETLIDAGDDLFASETFSTGGIERMRAWAEENGCELTVASRNAMPRGVRLEGQVEGPEIALTYFIEPERYPLYGTIKFIEPADISLAQALAEPNHIVIAERLAEALDVGVGDALRLAGPDAFLITAITDDGAEASMSNLNSVLLAFAYLRYDVGVEEFDAKADTVYVKLPPGSEVEVISEDFLETFSGMDVFTTEDLREQNSELSATLTQLITTMGLVSLLIGGIGIINTMLVVVGRRTMEIGVLKTIGLQGRQITLMFLIEAFLLGLLGSIPGVLLGLGLVSFLQGVAERVFVQSLQFAVYPEAVVMGLVTGMLVTLVFGFLPTLSAGRVRPNVVLFPTGTAVPRAGRRLSLLVVILLTAIMGLLVGQILENLVLGIGIAYGTMVVMGIAVLILGALVWILSRLPALGSTYIKLSQRAIGGQAGRTASTLLALVVGMFALSLVLLLTGSIINVINNMVASQMGGNVIVVPTTREAEERVAGLIGELDGIKAVTHEIIYQAEIVAINGDRDMETLLENAALTAGETSLDASDWNRRQLGRFAAPFEIRLASESEEEYEVAEGSDVTPSSDSSIVLQTTDETEWLGLKVGDTLTLLFEGGDELVITVAGLTAKQAEQSITVTVNAGDEQLAVGSDDVIPAGLEPLPSAFVIDAEKEWVNETLATLSDIPDIFALEVTQLNEMMEQLINQFTALPMVVAVLALFTSGVIIANTVSLATLERRRQIGIMKAIGLQSSDVLRLLLLENGLIGLMGGVIGAGIGAIGVVLLGVLSDDPGSFPFLTLAGLVLLAVAIALCATIVTAYGAAREKPLIVLRHE